MLQAIAFAIGAGCGHEATPPAPSTSDDPHEAWEARVERVHDEKHAQFKGAARATGGGAEGCRINSGMTITFRQDGTGQFECQVVMPEVGARGKWVETVSLVVFDGVSPIPLFTLGDFVSPPIERPREPVSWVQPFDYPAHEFVYMTKVKRTVMCTHTAVGATP